MANQNSDEMFTKDNNTNYLITEMYYEDNKRTE